MKKYIVLAAITGMVLGGCGTTMTNQPTDQSLQAKVVEKTGIIVTKTADGYILNTSDGTVEINSTKVNLEPYLKKTVTVSGMYSGSELYVDKIQSP